MSIIVNNYFKIERIINKLIFPKKKRVTVHSSEFIEALGTKGVAIDCGANVGIVSEILLSHGFRVFSFEPHPEAYKELVENLNKYYKNKNEEMSKNVINSAVGTKVGKLKLFLHQDSAIDDKESLVKHSTGATLISSKTNVNTKNFFEVNVIKLSDFILSIEGNIEILKIDIEGEEFNVLWDLLFSGALNKCKRVYVETHESKVPFIFTQRVLFHIVSFLIKPKICLNWD